MPWALHVKVKVLPRRRRRLSRRRGNVRGLGGHAALPGSPSVQALTATMAQAPLLLLLLPLLLCKSATEHSNAAKCHSQDNW